MQIFEYNICKYGILFSCDNNVSNNTITSRAPAGNSAGLSFEELRIVRWQKDGLYVLVVFQRRDKVQNSDIIKFGYRVIVLVRVDFILK